MYATTGGAAVYATAGCAASFSFRRLSRRWSRYENMPYTPPIVMTRPEASDIHSPTCEVTTCTTEVEGANGGGGLPANVVSRWP